MFTKHYHKIASMEEAFRLSSEHSKGLQEKFALQSRDVIVFSIHKYAVNNTRFLQSVCFFFNVKEGEKPLDLNNDIRIS